MESEMKHENENENGNWPELERDASGDADADGISSSSNHEPNNLSTINPLSDTTTDSREAPRPTITSTTPSDPLQLKPPSTSTPTGREERKSVRIDHPDSSVYGLGVVEDQNNPLGLGKDMNANPPTSITEPLRTSTQQHQHQHEHQYEQQGKVDNQNQEVSDGTWNSNTLTLASTSSNQGQKGMKSDPIYTREQADKIQMDWEETWERQKREKWQEKVRRDLEGWRGGHGTPRSEYSPTAITTNSFYGTAVTGTIGHDLPKEVLRIERDWSGGEVCQFETSFPMELERRISPTQLHDFLAALNTRMISAYSTKAAVVDNLIAIATWWTSLWFRPGHFELELRKIEDFIEVANKETFNPVGLNVLSPRRVALLFLEIEYY